MRRLFFHRHYKYIPNKTVLAFGSRVSGSAKPFSDLDIAILNSQPLPFEVYVELKNAFEESNFPFKIDIIDYATIDESFKKIITTCYYVVQCSKQDSHDSTDAFK